MKEKIILAIKGFMMGIANLIPGVSGGTLALTLGIYEDLIGAISHFFKNIKNIQLKIHNPKRKKTNVAIYNLHYRINLINLGILIIIYLK